MNPEWIEPADQPQTPIKLDAIWDNYLKRLKLVEIFHDKLGDYYHKITHAHYGADENNPAWTNFSWELKRENRPQGGSLIATEVTTRAPNAELSENKADGTILIGITGMASGRLFIPTVFSKYVMSKADLLGDGTVPECSGADSAVKAKFSAKMTGYNHQDSYGNTAVMDATIYSVARIAKDA